MVWPVEQWLHKRGMLVGREMPSPWGVCDLVACALRRRAVRHRLKRGQSAPLGPMLRIQIFFEIPHEDADGFVDVESLLGHFGRHLTRERLESELGKLIKARFINKTRQGYLQRLDGWAPLHNRLCALELKRTRVEEAFRQALANQAFAEESSIALPMARAASVGKSSFADKLKRSGVGLIGVSEEACRTVIRPRPGVPDVLFAAHFVERFWRAHFKDIRASLA